MSIHTLLFDLDGTLIDTNELIITSFMHTFEQYGKELSREQAIQFIGPPLRDTFEQIDAGRVDDMVETYRKHNLYHHDDYVIAFPYVVEVIDTLKKSGFKLGVVTTKMPRTTEMGLKVSGLDSYFDTIITLDDVTHPKPNAEPVLKAMRELDADGSTTVMVGDNSHDIEGGHNAGIRTAAVAWSLKGREKLLEYNPTYMLDDMRDLLKIAGV